MEDSQVRTMEDVSQRIQKAVESFVDDIDQSVSRPQQAGDFDKAKEG